ncbi:DUF4113 domain-containing protein [Ottowia oryzae]
MVAVDGINARWGRAAPPPMDHEMRQARRTPQYTTDWHQVSAHAGVGGNFALLQRSPNH